MRLYTPYSLSRGAPSATRSQFLKEAEIMPPSGGRLVQIEGFMQRSDGQFHIFFVDHDRGLDLAGRNHLDVDALFAQHAKHLARHAHMAAHADAHDADLADLGVAHD